MLGTFFKTFYGGYFIGCETGLYDVNIMKPVALTMENVMIMGVHFQGLDGPCVVVSKIIKQNSIIIFVSVFVFSFI